MKNILLFTFFFLIGIVTAQAQLQQGNVMLGADLGSGLTSTGGNGLLSFNFGLNEGAGFNLGISPKMGYFLNDNFVVGVLVNLGFSKSAENNGESTKTTVYGAQAFSRYYISPEDAKLQNLVKAGRFFLETSAGIAGVNVKDGPTTNGFAYGFGPGYSYFLNSNIALEASAKYNGLVGGGNRSYQNSLGVNLGIQIFLSPSETRDRIEEDFNNDENQ